MDLKQFKRVVHDYQRVRLITHAGSHDLDDMHGERIDRIKVLGASYMAMFEGVFNVLDTDELAIVQQYYLDQVANNQIMADLNIGRSAFYVRKQRSMKKVYAYFDGSTEYHQWYNS